MPFQKQSSKFMTVHLDSAKKYQPEGWYFLFLVGPPGLEPGTKGL
jgi:hypothetical protein